MLNRQQYEILGMYGDKLADVRKQLGEIMAQMQDQLPDEAKDALYDQFMAASGAVNRSIGLVLQLQIRTTHAMGGVRRVTA